MWRCCTFQRVQSQAGGVDKRSKDLSIFVFTKRGEKKGKGSGALPLLFIRKVEGNIELLFFVFRCFKKLHLPEIIYVLDWI